MEELERLVSVIICADIVGYTSMMHKDEPMALRKLKHFEETLQLETGKHNGEIIKSYGDGCLLLFSSAINAIRCAINIQHSLRREPEVPLRLGVHIGEIVRKNYDIFGNGVNVASRIESMGVANSVLISEDVYTQIKNHPEFQVQNLGAFNFKNVDREIDLFAITNGDLVVPLNKDMKGKGKMTEVKSFLPKWNIEQIAMFLILIIGVIFIYKVSNSVKSLKTPELTSDLRAMDFYLKAELHQRKESPSDIDTAIVYYNKAIENDARFAMAYSNLASAYMRKFLSFDPDPKWEEEAYAAAGKALHINPELADPYVIRGQFYWSQSHNFAHEEAINEFDKAITLDPNLSQGYEQLALVQLHIGLFEKAYKNANKSLEIDPGNFRARRFLGEILLFQGKYESALKEFEKIPNKFSPHPTQSLIALNYFYLDLSESAIALLDENLINNPNNPNLNSVYAMILASRGQYDEAEAKKEIAIENSRDFIHAHHTYYQVGVASAIMNDKADAIKWLDLAAKTGFPNYPLFNSDPYLANLKQQSDYILLLQELKEKWDYFKTI